MLNRKDVPNVAKSEMTNPSDPTELGSPMAEPTGAWRILRNSLIAAGGGAAVVLAYFQF